MNWQMIKELRELRELHEIFAKHDYVQPQSIYISTQNKIVLSNLTSSAMFHKAYRKSFEQRNIILTNLTLPICKDCLAIKPSDGSPLLFDALMEEIFNANDKIIIEFDKKAIFLSVPEMYAINNHIYKKFPQNVWQCFIGENRQAIFMGNNNRVLLFIDKGYAQEFKNTFGKETWAWDVEVRNPFESSNKTITLRDMFPNEYAQFIAEKSISALNKSIFQKFLGLFRKKGLKNNAKFNWEDL